MVFFFTLQNGHKWPNEKSKLFYLFFPSFFLAKPRVLEKDHPIGSKICCCIPRFRTPVCVLSILMKSAAGLEKRSALLSKWLSCHENRSFDTEIAIESFRFVFFFLFLSIHPSIHLSIHPSIRPTIYSCIHPSVRPSIRSFVRLFFRWFIHSFLHSFARLFVRSPIYLVDPYYFSCYYYSCSCIIQVLIPTP